MKIPRGLSNLKKLLLFDEQLCSTSRRRWLGETRWIQPALYIPGVDTWVSEYTRTLHRFIYPATRAADPPRAR